jgi:hypothetical protein
VNKLRLDQFLQTIQKLQLAGNANAAENGKNLERGMRGNSS